MTERRGVPERPVFWTLDQVAAMLNLPVGHFIEAYVWFRGRDAGAYTLNYLQAVNLAATTHGDLAKTEWRIVDSELVRWLAKHNLWVYSDQVASPTPLSTIGRRPLQKVKQTGIVVDIEPPPEL